MKKLLVLLLFISSFGFAQTGLFNEIKVTGSTENNTAERVVVQDPITKKYHWILKSSLIPAVPTLQTVSTAGSTTDVLSTFNGGLNVASPLTLTGPSTFKLKADSGSLFRLTNSSDNPVFDISKVGNYFSFYNNSGYYTNFNTSGLTGNVNLTIPNTTGTVALIGDMINDDVTALAPTQNAVYEALQGKVNTSSLTAGRIPYATSTNTLGDSSRLLWDNTSSYLEMNGNNFGLRFKETLNNSYVDIVNGGLGSSTLAFKSNYGSGKTLMTLSNPTGTNAAQLAIGDVTSIPAESQLYIYGGNNGANIDMRGKTTRDETNMDFEGSDWASSPNSLGFSYFGPNYSIGGTVMGYPKIKTGVVRFNNADNALIVSNNGVDVTPIRFGINDTEVVNIDDLGINILNNKGFQKLTDNYSTTSGNGGFFKIGNFGQAYDRIEFLSKDHDTDNFGHFTFIASVEEGLQMIKQTPSGGSQSVSFNNGSFVTTSGDGDYSSSSEHSPYGLSVTATDASNSSTFEVKPDGISAPLLKLFDAPNGDFGNLQIADSQFFANSYSGYNIFGFSNQSGFNAFFSADGITGHRLWGMPDVNGEVITTGGTDSGTPLNGNIEVTGDNNTYKIFKHNVSEDVDMALSLEDNLMKLESKSISAPANAGTVRIAPGGVTASGSEFTFSYPGGIPALQLDGNAALYTPTVLIKNYDASSQNINIFDDGGEGYEIDFTNYLGENTIAIAGSSGRIAARTLELNAPSGGTSAHLSVDDDVLEIKNAAGQRVSSVQMGNLAVFGTSGGFSGNFDFTEIATSDKTQKIINANGRIPVIRTSAPSSSTATGVKGEIYVDASYIYYCYDTNLWRRVAGSTF